MQHIEKWVTNEGLKAHIKMTIEGHAVAIADDDEPHFDSPREFPSGYYITLYAVEKWKQVVAQPLYFDVSHKDMTSRTPKGRIAARLNTAIANARSWIRDAKLAGYYE